MTYPEAGVKDEMGHWLTAKVDVSVHADLARLFDVPAIPTAVAVAGDGRILGRVQGFVEPAAFRGELRKLREGAPR